MGPLLLQKNVILQKVGNNYHSEVKYMIRIEKDLICPDNLFFMAQCT